MIVYIEREVKRTMTGFFPHLTQSILLCYGVHNIRTMIASFRHRGLKELFHQGYSKLVRQDLQKRALYLLDMLMAATRPEDLRSTPGVHLHRLKGERQAQWAISVNGPWRIIFEFEGGNAHHVDLEQYH